MTTPSKDDLNFRTTIRELLKEELSIALKNLAQESLSAAESSAIKETLEQHVDGYIEKKLSSWLKWSKWLIGGSSGVAMVTAGTAVVVTLWQLFILAGTSVEEVKKDLIKSAQEEARLVARSFIPDFLMTETQKAVANALTNSTKAESLSEQVKKTLENTLTKASTSQKSIEMFRNEFEDANRTFQNQTRELEISIEEMKERSESAARNLADQLKLINESNATLLSNDNLEKLEKLKNIVLAPEAEVLINNQKAKTIVDAFTVDSTGAVFLKVKSIEAEILKGNSATVESMNVNTLSGAELSAIRMNSRSIQVYDWMNNANSLSGNKISISSNEIKKWANEKWEKAW